MNEMEAGAESRGREALIWDLRQEIERCKEIAQRDGKDYSDLKAENAKLLLQNDELGKQLSVQLGQIQALELALGKFGQHTAACWGQQSMVDKTCRCGLDEATKVKRFHVIDEVSTMTAEQVKKASEIMKRVDPTEDCGCLDAVTTTHRDDCPMFKRK